MADTTDLKSAPPMKIRVLSDLHLEFDTPEVIPYAQADLVILAGDIHNHAQGLRWAAQTFGAETPIVYVPGNHEYYDGEFSALEAAMLDTAHGWPNLHYLNNATLLDPSGKWRVLGTTLWADFTLFGSSPDEIARASDAASRVMFDFGGVIQVAWPSGLGADSTPRAFSTGDSIALHQRARAWLAAELAKPFAGQTIVVTHHAPHPLSLAARFATDPSSAGFVNDLPELVAEPVALWVHGHTHTAFDYRVNGTRVVCNPRGYLERPSGRPENPHFKWDYVVDL
jgi:3',5'-cyclic AMP phosphodiesterase CpdA